MRTCVCYILLGLGAAGMRDMRKKSGSFSDGQTGRRRGIEMKPDRILYYQGRVAFVRYDYVHVMCAELSSRSSDAFWSTSCLYVLQVRSFLPF